MALTLIEMSKLLYLTDKTRDTLKAFAQNSDILRVLPFEDILGGSFSYNVNGTLPGVAFRAYNQNTPVNITGCGVLNPQTEHLRLAGGELDVDAQLVATRGNYIRDTHESLKIKALALRITGQIINGDSDIYVRQFDGLKKRIIGTQLVPANINYPLCASPLRLESLDEAIKRVDRPTHIIMSKAIHTRLATVKVDTRWDQDEFGNPVLLYKNLPILIADYDDTGTRIIDFNEEGPYGSTNCTSIYIVSFNAGKIIGIQNGIMSVEDLGKLTSAPVYRTRIEWLMGMAAMNGKAASRIRGITDGPITYDTRDADDIPVKNNDDIWKAIQDISRG